MTKRKSDISLALLGEVRRLTKLLNSTKGKRRRRLLSKRVDAVIAYIKSLRPATQATIISLLLRSFDQ